MSSPWLWWARHTRQQNSVFNVAKSDSALAIPTPTRTLDQPIAILSLLGRVRCRSNPDQYGRRPRQSPLGPPRVAVASVGLWMEFLCSGTPRARRILRHSPAGAYTSEVAYLFRWTSAVRFAGGLRTQRSCTTARALPVGACVHVEVQRRALDGARWTPGTSGRPSLMPRPASRVSFPGAPRIPPWREKISIFTLVLRSCSAECVDVSVGILRFEAEISG